MPQCALRSGGSPVTVRGFCRKQSHRQKLRVTFVVMEPSHGSILDSPHTSVEKLPECNAEEKASRVTTEQDAKYRRNRSTSSSAPVRMSFSEGTLWRTSRSLESRKSVSPLRSCTSSCGDTVTWWTCLHLIIEIMTATRNWFSSDLVTPASLCRSFSTMQNYSWGAAVILTTMTWVTVVRLESPHIKVRRKTWQVQKVSTVLGETLQCHWQSQGLIQAYKILITVKNQNV